MKWSPAERRLQGRKNLGLAQGEGNHRVGVLCALKSHRHGRPLNLSSGTCGSSFAGLRLVSCWPGPHLLETLADAIGCVCVWGMFSTGSSAGEKRTALWLVALRGLTILEKGKKRGELGWNERQEERKRGRDQG